MTFFSVKHENREGMVGISSNFNWWQNMICHDSIIIIWGYRCPVLMGDGFSCYLEAGSWLEWLKSRLVYVYEISVNIERNIHFEQKYEGKISIGMVVWYGMVCRRLPELKVPSLYFFSLHQQFLWGPNPFQDEHIGEVLKCASLLLGSVAMPGACIVK